MDRAVDIYDTQAACVGCGGCTRCVDACPNHALTPEGLDTRRCIACITIEKGSPSGSDNEPPSGPRTGSGDIAHDIQGSVPGAARNAAGNKTKDLFNGFETVIDAGKTVPDATARTVSGASSSACAVSGPATAAATHGWLFGCDECQSVCPYNASAPMYANPRFTPLFDPREMTAEDWLTMTPEQFRQRFAATPLARAGIEKLKTGIGNICKLNK
jgi:epoxyqueuosine reductase QueG